MAEHVLDSLHRLHPLHVLYRIDQTVHSDALPTPLPHQNNENRRQRRVQHRRALGCLWHSSWLLCVHPHREALVPGGARRLHGSLQVLLWTPDSKHCHRRYHSLHADAGGLGPANLPRTKNGSFCNFRSGFPVSIPHLLAPLRRN